MFTKQSFFPSTRARAFMAFDPSGRLTEHAVPGNKPMPYILLKKGRCDRNAGSASEKSLTAHCYGVLFLIPPREGTAEACPRLAREVSGDYSMGAGVLYSLGMVFASPPASLNTHNFLRVSTVMFWGIVSGGRRSNFSGSSRVFHSNPV
jgi:hypothetical protein